MALIDCGAKTCVHFCYDCCFHFYPYFLFLCFFYFPIFILHLIVSPSRYSHSLSLFLLFFFFLPLLPSFGSLTLFLLSSFSSFPPSLFLLLSFPSLPPSILQSLSLLFSLDMFEDLISPLVAAQHFLTQACTKRKGVLDPVLEFCVSILQLPPEQRDYRKKDGALHVIGSVYEVLMKKVKYIVLYCPSAHGMSPAD